MMSRYLLLVLCRRAWHLLALSMLWTSSIKSAYRPMALPMMLHLRVILILRVGWIYRIAMIGSGLDVILH